MRAPVSEIVLFAATVVCLALCVDDGDALIGAVLFFPMAVSLVLIAESRRWRVPTVVPIICAASCVFMTLVCLYVLNWTEDTEMSQSLHSHIEGAVIWTTTFTSAFLIVDAVVIAADAFLNRIVGGFFTIFVSVGTMTLVWVFLAVFFNDEIDVRYHFSMEIAYIFVNGMLSLFAGIGMAKYLKGKHWSLRRIPREGSE